MKQLKYLVPFIFLIFIILVYNTSLFTTWRLYNGGVNKYKKSKYEEASNAFKRAAEISKEPILFFNWMVSETKLLKKSLKELEKNNELLEINYSTKFEQLTNTISNYHILLDSLLNVENLPDSIAPKIIYLKGNLSLMTKDTINAIECFSNAVKKQSNFKPALYELVKLKGSDSVELIDDSMRRLLINISNIREVEIVKNFKPF